MIELFGRFYVDFYASWFSWDLIFPFYIPMFRKLYFLLPLVSSYISRGSPNACLRSKIKHYFIPLLK